MPPTKTAMYVSVRFSTHAVLKAMSVRTGLDMSAIVTSIVEERLGIAPDTSTPMERLKPLLPAATDPGRDAA